MCNLPNAAVLLSLKNAALAGEHIIAMLSADTAYSAAYGRAG